MDAADAGICDCGGNRSVSGVKSVIGKEEWSIGKAYRQCDLLTRKGKPLAEAARFQVTSFFLGWKYTARVFLGPASCSEEGPVLFSTKNPVLSSSENTVLGASSLVVEYVD
ncbi:MAG: hypothetical protein MK135_08885 [Polyangiaceae bacterium]|nr:hypothetical protein [Polyangiaceae bacterium]